MFFNSSIEFLVEKSTLRVVEESGFYEYFDPLNGKPSGVNNFSWTAALVLDLELDK